VCGELLVERVQLLVLRFETARDDLDIGVAGGRCRALEKRLELGEGLRELGVVLRSTSRTNCRSTGIVARIAMR